MVAGLGVLVQYWLDSGLDPSPEIFHHYGFQALGAGVTFSIVFRTQLAWNRYWEVLEMGSPGKFSLWLGWVLAELIGATFGRFSFHVGEVLVVYDISCGNVLWN